MKINLRLFDKTKAELEADLDAMKKQNASLEKEKKSLVGQLEAATDPKQEAVSTGITPEQFLEERVPVQLIKDNDRYKDDVSVCLNGEICQIQRGKVVYLKRKFALILESQYRQQMIAADLQTKLQDEYNSRNAILS
jgi:hypothetical protein